MILAVLGDVIETVMKSSEIFEDLLCNLGIGWSVNLFEEDGLVVGVGVSIGLKIELDLLFCRRYAGLETWYYTLELLVHFKVGGNEWMGCWLLLLFFRWFKSAF